MSAAWFGIGMAENGKHDGVCEAAYAPFKRCVDLDPDHMRAHYGLGDVLRYVRKDDARAEKHFGAATRIDPNHAPAHYGLASILQKRGDVDGAIRAMLEYVRLSGDPDGRGKAAVAALLEKKKAGLAAKPNAEAKARPPLSSPPLRATSCGWTRSDATGARFHPAQRHRRATTRARRSASRRSGTRRSRRFARPPRRTPR